MIKANILSTFHNTAHAADGNNQNILIATTANVTGKY